MPTHFFPPPLAAASTLLVAFLLSSCGGPDVAGPSDRAGDDSASSELVPAAEGSVDYPLTLETAHGEVEIEERPERIATLGWNPNHDAAAALGVTPVYAASRSFAYGWMDDEWLDAVETLDEREDADLSLEGVAAADPDVIFMPHTSAIYEDEDIERLTAIAPVIEVPEEVPGGEVDWRDAPRLLGEVLDLGEAAERAIDEAESSIAATAAENPQFEGRTITIATDYGAEYGVEYYTAEGGTAEQVTEMLGFEPNPKAGQFTEDAAVSEENITELDADVLVVFYTDDATRKAREESELFQRVPAVADGRYVPVVAEHDERAEAGAGWVLRRGASVLGLPWTVEALADWANEVDLES